MKKIPLLILFSLLSIGAIAQSYNPITNENFTFSTGEKEVFKTSFNKVSAEEVSTAVKEYLKNYKARVEPVKGFDNEYVVSDVALSDINQSATTMNIKITELEGNATLYIHYLTNSKIVSKDNTPSEFDGYVKFTQALDNKATFIAYDAVVNLQSNVVEGKQNDLKGLEKDEEKQYDAIGKAIKSINDSKTSIISLEGSLKTTQALVAAKTQQVGDKQAEIAAVNIKTLESNIKDIEKENKIFVKDIEKSREDMAKINGENAVLDTELATNRSAIAAQKQLFAASADKKIMKEVQSLEKEAAKIMGEIEEKKGEIQNTEAAIITSQKQINGNNNRIFTIQKQITSHSEDALKDQLKILEKDLKDLDSEEKKNVKDIEKENDNITNQEEGIRQAEGEIASAKNAQAALKVEISSEQSQLKDLKSTQLKFK